MSERFFKFNNVTIKYLCFFMIGICLFFISYSFFSLLSPNKGDKYINNTMDLILKTNNKSKTFLDNSSLNVEKALETLPEMKSTLSDISIDLSSNEYFKTNEVPSSYNNLLKGLNENILIIDQLDAILKNPYGNDIQVATNNLKNFRDTSNNYYSLIVYEDSNYSLGVPLYSTIDASIDYCTSSNNLKKISELELAESTKFLDTLNEVVISIDNLKCDYYEKVIECRNHKITYDLLISDISDTILKLDAVKNVISQMSIPNNFATLYNNLSEIVDLYNDYLYEFKYALVTEKVRRENKDIKEDFMDSLYVSSKKTYSQVEVAYKIFIKSYNEVNDN